MAPGSAQIGIVAGLVASRSWRRRGRVDALQITGWNLPVQAAEGQAMIIPPAIRLTCNVLQQRTRNSLCLRGRPCYRADLTTRTMPHVETPFS